jgi:Transglutaminase-like superfamily
MRLLAVYLRRFRGIGFSIMGYASRNGVLLILNAAAVYKMKKIQKFLRLPPLDRQLLLETFLLLSSIRIGFLFLKFPLLQRLLGKVSQRRTHKSAISIDRIIWAIEVSTHLSPGGAKCLARALTVQTLMQQQGYESQLQIGVIHNSIEEFQAHAWIEYQGKIVIGELPDMEKYSALHPV